MTGGRVRIAVVGHVDHGKSTLIGRILRDTSGRETNGDLAHVTDQLAEERTGCLTMETTQAFCRFGEREVVFVDVPGHRELLRQMTTGTSRADAAILIVAADAGVCAQTRRHAVLLSMLAVERVVVVVINKIDAVADAAERFDLLCGQLRDALSCAGCPEPAATIPVSALHGWNVASPSDETMWYSGPTVIDALGEMPSRTHEPGAARFVVQSVLPFEGTTVYAGRLLDGSIAAGDQLTCWPGGEVASVERVLRFPEDNRPICAGESAAIALRGASVTRGCVLAGTSAEPPRVGTSLAVRVFWLDREPLRRGAELVLRFATQETHCVVNDITRRLDSDALVELNRDEVRETDVADLVLTTTQPIVTEPLRRTPALGRFVLERAGGGGGAIVAAGVVPG